MAFSNTPNDPVSEMNLLLTIAEKLEVLLDKNKREQLIKEVCGLSSVEKGKADEARTQIAQYEEAKADLRKKKAALDEFHQALQDEKVKQDAEIAAQRASLDAAQVKNDDAVSFISDRQRQLNELAETLDKIADKHQQTTKDLAIKAQETEVNAAHVRKGLEDLAAKKQEVAAYEASLKTKAAELQRLTQGL